MATAKEQLEPLRQQANESPLEKPVTIEASLLGPSNGGVERLINNADESFSVLLKRQTIEFPFTSPIYIHQVEVVMSANTPADLRLSASMNPRPGRTFTPATVSDDKTVITFQPHMLADSLEIRADRSWFDLSEASILAIRVTGITLDAIDKSIGQLSAIDKIKAQIDESTTVALANIEMREAALSKERQLHAAKVTETDAALATTTAQTAELQQQLKTLTAQEEAAQKALGTTTAQLEKVKAEVTQYQTNRDDLTKQITASRSNLKELEETIRVRQSDLRDLTRTLSLYANEYKSFFRQGNWYIILYSLLAFVPLCIMAFVVYQLFHGAVQLTQIYKTEPNLEPWTLFITRIPFVLVAGFLIQGAYYVFKLLALKIMDIQGEKMALSRLAIVAQDVVEISGAQLELSDEQIHDATIYLRMELLKAYMQQHIGKDYEYRVRDRSLLDRVLKRSPTGIVGAVAKIDPK